MPEIQTAGARVLVSDAEETIALIPRSDNQLCLFYYLANGDAGADCNTREIAETEGLSIFNRGWGIGVVPDGVDQVEFTLSDGSTVVVSVTNNVYHVPAEAVEGRVQHDGKTYSTTFLPRTPKAAG